MLLTSCCIRLSRTTRSTLKEHAKLQLLGVCFLARRTLAPLEQTKSLQCPRVVCRVLRVVRDKTSPRQGLHDKASLCGVLRCDRRATNDGSPRTAGARR